MLDGLSKNDLEGLVYVLFFTIIGILFMSYQNRKDMQEDCLKWREPTAQEMYEEEQWSQEEILLQQDINPNSQLWDIRDYAKYVLSNGDPKMKRELFKMFDYQFYLQNRMITTLRAH